MVFEPHAAGAAESLITEHYKQLGIIFSSETALIL